VTLPLPAEQRDRVADQFAINSMGDGFGGLSVILIIRKRPSRATS